MEALGTALEAQGASVTLVAAAELAPGSPPAEVIVVDSYRLRADNLARDSVVVAAVDDLVRDLAVDVVIDPAPGARPEDHPSAARVLAGARYALVTESSGPSPRPADLPVETVLVTTGGSDHAGIGADLAARLRRAVPGAGIRLVVGPWGHADVPAGVEAVHAPDGLGPELAAAGVVVTAGGVTMLEAMQLGRPTVVIVTAENQRRQVEGAAAAGAVTVAALGDVAGIVEALVHDDRERSRLSGAARALIDGHGPERAASVLLDVAGRPR